MTGLADRLNGTCGPRHLAFIDHSDRLPSAAVLDALRAALTADEWRYLIGESNELAGPVKVAA